MKAIAIGILMVGFGTTARATVTKADFGKAPDGHIVEVYTLTSGQVEARVITYGAKLISLRAPDRNGRVADLTLGYDTLPEWLADGRTHFGAIVGRYGNRIAKGVFTLDGHTYQIPVNNNGNALHGGTDGFDKKFWNARLVPDGVEMTLISPDGDMGFPGTLTAKVTYTLVKNSLTIHYEETSGKPTIVNLTNHTYFNLTGDKKEDVLGMYSRFMRRPLRRQIMRRFPPARFATCKVRRWTSALLMQSASALIVTMSRQSLRTAMTTTGFLTERPVLCVKWHSCLSQRAVGH
jgi:aldose 1-epimerase